jgi:structural maintenance of chromosome 2
MHVKEITVDGFKSYAQRVVIPGFDPQFNAITGLNGSGKSNILDSICFVLGITNLTQVIDRVAAHLNRLTYNTPTTNSFPSPTTISTNIPFSPSYRSELTAYKN